MCNSDCDNHEYSKHVRTHCTNSANRKCGDRCHCTDNNRRLEHIEAECTGIGNLIAKFYAMEIVLTMLLRSRLGCGVSGMQIGADAGTNAGDH